jgi:transposase-like protein
MAKYQKQASPARRKRKVFELVQPGMDDSRAYVEELARAHVQLELQRALEAERDEIVGRSWHDHHGAGTALQYRNGYGNPRSLVCGSGPVQIQMPRLRQAYDSKLVAKYDRLTPALQELIPQLYLHGLATGDFQQAFGWLWGNNAPLSSASIVRLKAQWEEDYRHWKERPLQEEYLYVWADAIYPKGGPVDETLALLVVLGVDRQGCKSVLAIEEGYRESEESWTDLFRNLKRRGVRWLGLVIGDGIDGLWKAVRTVFPMTRHQRCWVHKMRNILDKVPKKAHDEVLERLRLIYRANSYKEAQILRRDFVRRYHSLYPKAIESLEEAGEALFTYFRFPSRHWIHLKTTNPIESLFATVRIRTQAARRMRSRMGALCLVFQILKNGEHRLRRIRAYTIVADTIDQLRTQHSMRRKAA